MFHDHLAMKDIAPAPCRTELTLAEVLSDALVQAVMAADGVDPRQLAADLDAIARQRARARSADAGR